jgi:acyl-CoA synthetase (NDP forming)
MAIASQSGTVAAALADWASEERLGFSAFVSMGNRVAVDEADLIEFFAAIRTPRSSRCTSKG